MSSPKLVTVTYEGDLAIVTMDRPSALNALNAELLDDLDLALDEAEQHSDVRVVILTGNIKAFSVGGDLKEEKVDAAERVERMHALTLRLVQAYRKITIAAIEGWALGGGLEIAMGCTFRVAAAGSRLGVPEIAMGLIPGFGGTQLLPRLVGRANALKLLCHGEPIDAETALRIGLVDWIADAQGDALSCARASAGRFAKHSPAAQQAARIAVWEGLDVSLEKALEIERIQVDRLRGTDGIMQFREGKKNVELS